MKISEETVNDLIFSVEQENEEKVIRKKTRTIKKAYRNLRRIALEKIKGNFAEC